MPDPKVSRRVALIVAALTFVVTSGVSAQVSITSPASGARLPAGPDYATDVLGDPWDMSNPQDISQDPLDRTGWASFGFVNGRIGGSTAAVSGTADTTVGFLYRGFYGLPNPGRTGLRYPIDPNVYRKLSFKMHSGASGENVQVYWFQRPLGDPAGVGHGVRFVGSTPGGDAIHVSDLSQATADGSPWTAALVRGLRIDPNSSVAGHHVDFDWVRLTAPDGAAGAAMITISWTGGSGSSTIDVVDAGGTVMPIASGVTATSFSWNYGVLPPGQYTLRVRRGTAALATRAFSINNPPIILVTNPDDEGGADYATDVLHNPWDMAGAPDVIATSNVTGPSYSGNLFHGTSNSTGDPALFLLNQTNNGAPINTARYRYLTFNVQVDGVYDLARGSVARVFWGSAPSNDGSVMTTTKDIIVWPGMNRFTIDLGSLSATPTGGLEQTGAQQAWTAASVRHFRIDPHEFPEPRQFHLGEVKLAAVDEAAGSFTIRFAGFDFDNDAATVALYYDTNTNPSDGRTLIVSNVAMSAGAFQWNTASVPSGTYFIYAVANDGVQTYARYSTGPVAVSGGSGSTSDVVMSIDSPTNFATITGPFNVVGWAIDRGAASGTGVDQVHVYAYPNPGSGAPPTFLGVAGYGGARSDVGGAYGSQFTNSGYGLAAPALPNGNYQVVVYARSTVTGTFSASRSVMIQVMGAVSAPRMSLDAPAHNSVVLQSFAVGGWAIDTGAASGTGVDTVHLWAFPNPGSGQAAVFAGAATYGVPRSDVAAAFGGRFNNSGFSWTVNNLAPGTYQLVAYARSTVTGTFNNAASAVIRISAPVMSLDTPRPGATVTRPFAAAGWAIDYGAPSGTGVDTVHVWAFPAGGGAARFVGVAAYGAPRADVGSAYGSRFTNSGFNFAVPTSLPAGTYDLVAYARSTVSGTFNNWRVARVVVQ
jgi:hypothetical protein